MSTQYLTVDEYAVRAGVSPKTVRGMISRGELPAHRFGRLLRIDPEEAGAATVYRPGEGDEIAPRRRPSRPRPVRGEFSRRARSLPPPGGQG